MASRLVGYQILTNGGNQYILPFWLQVNKVGLKSLQLKTDEQLHCGWVDKEMYPGLFWREVWSSMKRGKPGDKAQRNAQFWSVLSWACSSHLCKGYQLAQLLIETHTWQQHHGAKSRGAKCWEVDGVEITKVSKIVPVRWSVVTHGEALLLLGRLQEGIEVPGRAVPSMFL